MKSIAKRLSLQAVIVSLLFFSTAVRLQAQEVKVISGSSELIKWLSAEDWWGEEDRSKQLEVPRVLMTGISTRWRDETKKMTVSSKKEIFYRLMLPLIMHANAMVMDRRAKLQTFQATLNGGQPLAAADLDSLRELAIILRILDTERAEGLEDNSPELLNIIDLALYKLDVIPAGLVLGQAAYESGYGTSRFAVEGNALFGQWTYGGKGLVPEQQRTELGDHRIASYDWPFDSVRGYFINLSSHPAYEEFRRLRAARRAAGEELTSMELADGLIAYSERGQEYVDTLKGIMRVNKLTIADNAVFRDEPIRFLVGADSPEEAVKLRAEIEKMRASGELDKTIARMRLE
jgi:Bax protein